MFGNKQNPFPSSLEYCPAIDVPLSYQRLQKIQVGQTETGTEKAISNVASPAKSVTRKKQRNGVIGCLRHLTMRYRLE
jgi:hypothetical protein